MGKLPNLILNHKKAILIVVAIAIVLSFLGMSAVNINYNLADYLSEDSPSTMGMKVMNESFSEGIPNLNVYIPDVSLPEAQRIKQRLLEIDGVSSAMWLDDVVDIQVPLEFQDKKTVEGFYKDGDALMMLSIDQDDTVRITAAVKELVGEGCKLSGEGANYAYVQSVTMGEVAMIMVFAVPLVLIILLLTTSSWFEPILFLITIGVAILLNEGTNFFLGEISYVTQATSAILQLAVSIDYAVFLLNSFAGYRKQTSGVEEAMRLAIIDSSTAISSSMLTTFFGFIALVLMKFRIGADMGIVLAKGVFLSFVTVMILLPVVAIYAAKIMDKTRHRSFMPSFSGFGRFITRICIPLSVFIALLIIPSFKAQMNNEFIYGSSSMNGPDAPISLDKKYINNIFGGGQQMVLMIPEGDIVSEKAMADDLMKIPLVSSVTSFTNMVGVEVPSEFLTPEQRSNFRGGGFSRIILYADTDDEGDVAFRAVDDVREVAERYYPDSYYLVGNNVVNYDLKETITGDNVVVTLSAVLAIGLVLVAAFKSLSLPLILILTIEGAIWINLGLPYLMGDSMNFIGYQIISAVQLGATVDYGILFAKHYIDNRVNNGKRTSIRKTVEETAGSIITPVGILFIAGMVLGLVSTNGVISQLGIILGRGALISAFMVLFFLPALLLMFDWIIPKTSLGLHFMKAKPQPADAGKER
ncbi:MAG: MMPL family transporter [Oscillospiraceae bacterium]